MLKILPVRVKGPTGSLKAFVFLDDGSTVTLIDAQFARTIGIRGERVNIEINGIREASENNSVCEKVNFEIQSEDCRYEIKGALAATNLRFPFQSLSAELVRHIAKTQSIFLQPYQDAHATILIGQDNWRLMIAKEFRTDGKNYALSHTPLGWAVHGVIGNFPKTSVSSICAQATSIEDVDDSFSGSENLDELITNYFNIESLGIREEYKNRNKISRASEILKQTSRCVGKSWETGMLWKSDEIQLVDSRATALRRLLTLERRLDRDERYAELYYKEMNRLFELGYAVRANEEASGPRVWYMPHFGVTNVSKPGKVRLVFDAAAKTAGCSLNDQLDPGPDLLQNLFGILIRFRQHAVAVTADIKDMYLRINVREEDRSALRFLWRGRDRKKHPEVFEMTRLVFGANSSPTSAIYVKDANAKRFFDEMPDAASTIIRNSYVDDLLASRETEVQAMDLVRDVIKINAEANFEMHGWASNRPSVLSSVSEQARRVGQCKTALGAGGNSRVLGMYWNTQSDTLSFNTGEKKMKNYSTPGAKSPTKREYLKCMMSVYDPLGLLVPFTLKSKLIMQDVWRSEISWDERLRDDEHEAWKAWIKVMESVGNLEIPRCLAPTLPHESVQIHAFCDASLKAYAATVYLRFQTNGNFAHTALVMAKSRVAPLKPLSVPRLELQAALLAARLVNSVEKELDLKPDKRFLWSDSQTVLFWIRAEPRTRQVFVAHRLGEINETTSVREWRWVPTKLNPADCATRGNCEDEAVLKAWFNGPKFLETNESECPQQRSLSTIEKEALEKLEARKTYTGQAVAFSLQRPLFIRLLGWRGYILIAHCVRKCFEKWRKYNRRICHEKEIVDRVDEVTRAEEYTIRHIQSECFSKEMSCLTNSVKLPKNSKIVTFSPIIDCNGFLRANGRITGETVPASLNCPIIIDGKHAAVKLLIKEFHVRYKHASNETVLNELRQIYHIIGLRNALKSVIAHCLTCKLRRARPSNPLMAPLPACRLAVRQRPFSHCGVDYFGPLSLRVRRSNEKRWGVLFTCMTTRAVLIELAKDLTADSAIMALQRLAGRRGMPTDIYSDNGTNFRGACGELMESDKKLAEMRNHTFVLKNKIRWHFNPPDAPHMGGAWERMIKSVKIALHASLKNEVPNEEVLHTVLVEIEHMINSRPLTHVSPDPRDEEALTPNHFLIGSSSGNFKLGTINERSLCGRKQWRNAQVLADRFWSRWLREYLPTLVPRKKWHDRGESIAVNDIVLVVDLQAPRNVWKKGRVMEVFPGADQIVRTAKVRTSKGEYVRPAHKLVKLFRDEVQNDANFARGEGCDGHKRTPH